MLITFWTPILFAVGTIVGLVGGIKYWFWLEDRYDKKQFKPEVEQ